MSEQEQCMHGKMKSEYVHGSVYPWLTKVDPANQLPYNHDVSSLNDLTFQTGSVC